MQSRIKSNVRFGMCGLLASFYLVSSALAGQLTHLENQLDDLTRLLPEDEVKTALAGELNIPVLISEQDGPHARGSALLLPDIGLQAGQIQAFSDLRMVLNQYGWVTIGSIAPQSEFEVYELNDEQAKLLTAKPSMGAEQIEEERITLVKTQLKQILSTLNNEADGYGGLKLIVAQGASAGWLVESIIAGEIQRPDALVLIAPYLPEYKSNKALPAKIAKLEVPVLDVWSENDNRWALATVENRQKAAKKYLMLHYRQRQLFGRAGFLPRESRLGKEIYAYMTYLGW